MKIAVLTLPFSNNYGGYLQAYALMEILKKLGHEPELLYVQLKNRSQFKKIIGKYFLSKREKLKKIVEKNTIYFSDTYINPKTEKIYSANDFIKYKNIFDAYIVGSDQVWRPTMNKYIDQAFFGFVTKPKAILLSYAASFGLDKWEYTEEQTKKFKKEINHFNAVSVREESGIELCEKYFDVKANHVLDPTMLLSVEDYRKIIRQEKESSFNGELLTYFLDKTEEKQYLEDMVAKVYGLKSYSVNVKSKGTNVKLEDKIYPTVTSWLKGFDDAQYIVTDSFHGCAFAILFNKPFIVYGNEKRGMARFNSLLKIFGLENRLVLNKKDITIEMVKKEIPWDKVNTNLRQYQNISREFLINNLQVR